MDIGAYEERTGIIENIYIKNRGSSECQYINIEDFDVFVKCGDLSEIKLNVGDNIKYYYYNGSAFYTKGQMQSSNSLVKALDIGMLVSLFIAFMISIFFIPMYLIIAKKNNKIDLLVRKL